MSMELTLSVIGIILAGLAFLITKRDIFSILSKIKIRRAIKKRHKINNDIKTWVVNYYICNGEGENLFTIPNGRKIPYLSKPSWHRQGSMSSKVKFNLSNIKTNIKVDNKIVERRKLVGQNVWNGNVLSLSGLLEQDNMICVNLQCSTYFEYLTVADKMAWEAERCQRRGLILPEFRNSQARTIYHLQNNEPHVQVLGFTVSVVFNMGDCDYVLIQKRANETGIAEDKWAVVPSYVCEPLDFSYPVGFDLHYFLLEFYEELFDKEDLSKENRHLKPDWFYDDDPIKTILSLGSDFSFNILGVGFDAITTEFNVAALAYFSNPLFCKTFHSSIRRNWEIKGFELKPLFSKEYNSLIVSDDLYHTSAFTLACLNSRFPYLKKQATSTKNIRVQKKSPKIRKKR